jgi:hypothetical protein
MVHKETFSQSSGYGIPWHVVVQYWDDDGDLQASYFDSWESAEAFEQELRNAKNNSND